MINLLPDSNKKEIKKEYYTRLGVVVAIFLSALLVVRIASLLPSYLLISAKHKSFLERSNSAGHQDIQAKRESLEKVVTEINAKVAMLSGPEKATPSPEKVFSEIISKKPSGIQLNSLSYEDATQSGTKRTENASAPQNIRLSIVGTAKERNTLLSFVEMLNKDPLFSSVDLPISSLVKDRDLNFTLAVSLNVENAQ